MYVNDCVAIWFRSRGRQKADKRHHLFGIRMASSESPIVSQTSMTRLFHKGNQEVLY